MVQRMGFFDDYGAFTHNKENLHLICFEWPRDFSHLHTVPPPSNPEVELLGGKGPLP